MNEQATLLTHPERVVLAAADAAQHGSVYTTEDLVIRAWRLFPEAFSMVGYGDYPDSHKVSYVLMGEKGLVKRGFLERVGSKVWRLTEAGRELAEALRERLNPTPEPEPVKANAKRTRRQRLTAEQESLLQHLLTSQALALWQEGLKNEWTFATACKFWAIVEGDDVQARLDDRADKLRAIRTQLQKGGAVLSNGREVDTADLDRIEEVGALLAVRFSRHSALMSNRARRQEAVA